MKYAKNSDKNRTKRIGWLYFLVFILAVLALNEWAIPHVIPKRFGAVVDGIIYRSGQMPDHLVGRLTKKYNLKTVIALNGRGKGAIAEKKYIEPLGVKHHAFQLKGNGTGDPDVYIQTLTLMKQAVDKKQPLLVHCAAGSQRTGAAVAMYRILFQGWQPEQVLKELQKYDWKPHKNGILIDYMNEHLPHIHNKLLETGILSQPVDFTPIS